MLATQASDAYVGQHRRAESSEVVSVVESQGVWLCPEHREGTPVGMKQEVLFSWCPHTGGQDLKSLLSFLISSYHQASPEYLLSAAFLGYLLRACRVSPFKSSPCCELRVSYHGRHLNTAQLYPDLRVSEGYRGSAGWCAPLET